MSSVTQLAGALRDVTDSRFLSFLRHMLPRRGFFALGYLSLIFHTQSSQPRETGLKCHGKASHKVESASRYLKGPASPRVCLSEALGMVWNRLGLPQKVHNLPPNMLLRCGSGLGGEGLREPVRTSLGSEAWSQLLMSWQAVGSSRQKQRVHGDTPHTWPPCCLPFLSKLPNIHLFLLHRVTSQSQ